MPLMKRRISFCCYLLCVGHLFTTTTTAKPPNLERFAQHGYRTISRTISRGKIFHTHSTSAGQDRGQWTFQDWSCTDGGVGADRSRLTSRNKNLIDLYPTLVDYCGLPAK